MKFLLLSIFLVLHLGQASAQSTSTTISNWNDEFLDEWRDRASANWNNAADALIATIWQGITDIDTGLIEIPALAHGPLTPGISYAVSRRIFNNQNIMSSYTAVDFLRLGVALPVGVSIPIPNAGGMSASFKLTTGIDFNSMNARIVNARDLPRLPETEDMEVELQALQQEIQTLTLEQEENENSGDDEDESDEDQELDMTAAQNISDEDLRVADGPDGISVIPRSDERERGRLRQGTRLRARLGHLHNLIFNAYRIPFTNRGIERLGIGEIVSYGVDGYVSFDVSVGWEDVGITSVDGVTAAIGARTYLRGKYRVSLIKEDAHHIQVKLTRARQMGLRLNLGVVDEIESFEGFLIADKRVGRIYHQIIPFNFNMTRERLNAFDTSYRFDLRVPAARDAFRKALFGQMSNAGELAQDNTSGVEWVMNQRRVQSVRTRGSAPRLFLWARANRETSFTITDAVITMPDNAHYILEGQVENLMRFETVWGNRSMHRYRYFIYDRRSGANPLEAQNAASQRGLYLTGDIQDTRTHGDELQEYIQEVEKVTGKGWPETDKTFPLVAPSTKCQRFLDRGNMNRYERCQRRKASRARYGLARFHYRIALSDENLERFFNYDEEQMWPVLEKAFELTPGRWQSLGSRVRDGLRTLPLVFLNILGSAFQLRIDEAYRLYKARNFIRHWRALKNEGDFREKIEHVGKMFRGQMFNKELIHVLRIVCDDEELPYLVRAQNHQTFGSLSFSNGIVDVGTETRRLLDRVNFENPDAIFRLNEDLLITNIRLKRINPDAIELRMTIPKRTQYLFASLEQGSRTRRLRVISRFVVKMPGEGLEAGQHVFRILRENNEGTFEARLAEFMFNPVMQRLSLSMRYENAWGPTSSSLLRLPRALQPEESEND